MTKSIGLVGVGTMGQVLLKRLIESGHEVIAADVSEVSRAKAIELGADIAENPEAVARGSEVSLLSLPAPAHILAVVGGENGLLGTVGPGHIIVDTSTVDPGTTRTAAGCHRQCGPLATAPPSSVATRT